jgi:hypothetical protein
MCRFIVDKMYRIVIDSCDLEVLNEWGLLVGGSLYTDWRLEVYYTPYIQW